MLTSLRLRPRRGVGFAAVAVSAAAMLAACSSGGSTASGEASAAASEAAPAATAAASAAASAAAAGGCEPGQKFTVGYSTYNLNNPYFAGIVKGLQDQTKEQGWDLVIANSEGSVEKEVANIENLVTQGADFIMTTPIDGKAINGALQKAVDAGIPIFALGDAPVFDGLTQAVLPQNQSAAETIVDTFATFLEDRYGEVKGNIVDITGIRGISAAEEREEGFQTGIAKYPGMKVVATQDGGFVTDKANEVMTSILQANPEIDAVFTANDAEAVGVIAAIKAAGRFVPYGEDGHIMVMGIDGALPALEAIRAKEMYGTVSQNPIEMSKAAVKNALDLKCNGATLENPLYWPMQLISIDNIDSQEVKDYGLWGDEVAAAENQ